MFNRNKKLTEADLFNHHLGVLYGGTHELRKLNSLNMVGQSSKFEYVKYYGDAHASYSSEVAHNLIAKMFFKNNKGEFQ
jgi:hypothetical protein